MICNVRTQINRLTTTLIGDLAPSSEPLQLKTEINHRKADVHKQHARGGNFKEVSYGLRLQAREFSASYSERGAVYVGEKRYPCCQLSVIAAPNDKHNVLQAGLGHVKLRSFDFTLNAAHAFGASSLLFWGPNNAGCNLQQHFLRDAEPWKSIRWHSGLAKSRRTQDLHEHNKNSSCKLASMGTESFMRYCQNGRLPTFYLHQASGVTECANILSPLKYLSISLISGRMTKYCRMTKYSPCKRHWMRLSRAVILIEGKHHLVYECSATFPIYWADEINTKVNCTLHKNSASNDVI